MNKDVFAGLAMLLGALIAMLGMIFAAFGVMLIFSFLMSWPVYMLWNGCLVGAVAGVSTVTWLQAWGLTILCSFLFKSNTTKSKKD